MEKKFNLNSEEFKMANRGNGETFFKYLKSISRNKSPVIISGKKSGAFWDCDVYECQVPTSHFNGLKLPAPLDKNEDDTSFYLLLNEKLMSTIIAADPSTTTSFILGDSNLVIRSGPSKCKISYSSNEEELKALVEEFLPVFEENDGASVTLKLNKTPENLELLSVLKEIAGTPTGELFVDQKGFCFLNDTILFQSKNSSDFTSTKEGPLYLNSYLASKILSFLDYCDSVVLKIDDTHTIIKGLDNTQTEVVKNVSAIFENDAELPDEESIAENKPSKETEVKINLKTFLDTIKSYSGFISTFAEKKNFEASLYKNGDGISLGISNTESLDAAVITLNIGEVENEETESSEFTNYAVVIPLNTLKNTLALKGEETELVITWDSGENTAVSFETGSVSILSGKLI